MEGDSSFRYIYIYLLHWTLYLLTSSHSWLHHYYSRSDFIYPPLSLKPASVEAIGVQSGQLNKEMKKEDSRNRAIHNARRFCCPAFVCLWTNTNHKAIPAKLKYGIFLQRNRRFAYPRYRTRSQPWNLGRHQPAGRLRQRQSCDTFVTEKVTH